MTKVDEGLVLIAEAAQVLSRVLRRSAETQVGLDPLPASEFDVLKSVESYPDSTVSDVARTLRLQTSNVSTTVRSLVERGLVVRVPDARDQRRTRLRMSSTAERRRLLVESAWVASLASALDEMPVEDVAALLSAAPALARLAEIVTLRETPNHRFEPAESISGSVGPSERPSAAQGAGEAVGPPRPATGWIVPR